MDKRTFLKTSSALAAGTVLSQFVACTSDNKPLSNWAGNLEYSTSNVHYPKTIEEVQQLVKQCDKLRALGSRHSFNKIADSTENQVSTKELNKVIALDKVANTVTVEAGMKYGELCQYLDENGYALHNLASLPHISIGGSCATATHGSGVKNGNLSTGVSAIEFVNAKGDIVALSKNDGDSFYGAVVGLGAMGIVTKLTLDLLPTFKMQQVVYRNLPMSELENNFLTIMSSGYSVSLFTDWRNKNINEVWIKSKIEEGSSAAEILPELYGAKLATKNMHPVEELDAANCTDQMGAPGVWYERMPHFKMGFTPSAGKELQAEYFVPIKHGYEAMMAVEKLHDKISPHLFISEIRSVAADDLWMSPCYKKDCIAIHTTWKQEWDEVMNLLPLMEEQLAPFNPRPHWAKLFTLSPTVLQSRIEKLEDFKKLVGHYDSDGKFRNEFLDKNLFSK
ncbi:MAG: FAD-binding protein [Chryseolinea sp.]